MYSGFEVAVIIIIMICAGIFFGGSYYGKYEFKAQAVERGYAEYCSTTGNWSWIGECENEQSN